MQDGQMRYLKDFISRIFLLDRCFNLLYCLVFQFSSKRQQTYMYIILHFIIIIMLCGKIFFLVNNGGSRSEQ